MNRASRMLAAILLSAVRVADAQEISFKEMSPDIVAMTADGPTQLKILESRLLGEFYRLHVARNERLNAEFAALPETLPSVVDEAVQCTVSEPLSMEMAETMGVLRTLARQLDAAGRWLARRPQTEVRALGEGYRPLAELARKMEGVERGLREAGAELEASCRRFQAELPRVEVSISGIEWPTSEPYRVLVKGRVQNRSGRNLGRVILRLALLDQGGTRLGVTSTSVGPIAANAAAGFEALGLFPTRLARAEVLEALDASGQR